MRFIGRDADLFRIDELFRQGQRVIGLWGPGGIGKSRLAERIAEQAGRERVRTAWCAMESARSAADVEAAVVRAVPGVDVAGERVIETLRRAGELLVVLDGADRIAGNLDPFVTDWLAGAPHLRVLLTTRQRTRAAGAVTYEILPLSTPEAVDLFVDRARLLRPDFRASVGNRELIVELVERLEKIPVAVELAAGRIDVLGIEGILRRLGDQLSVLSIRDTIAESWELLSVDERAGLAQSSVFCGGFSIDAAEAVLDLEPSISVLDVLHSLRDKSLLRTFPVGEGVRFGHYESIRAFAAEERDAEPGRSAVIERHSAYFLSLNAAAPGTELADEVQNLLTVRRNAIADGRADDVLRAALLLDRTLSCKGPVELHLEVLDSSLKEAGGADHHLQLAVLRARGNARRLRGDLEGANLDLDAAVTGASGALRAAALADLGVVHHQRRNMREAERCYGGALEAAREAAREADVRETQARCLGNLAALAHDEGRFDEAEARYREALAIFSDLGDRRHEGIFLGNLAVLEKECERMDDARTHFRAALGTLELAGDRRLEGITLANLAALEHTDGNLEESRATFERALGLLEETGELRSEALCRGRLAAVLATLGELHAARQSIDQAERALDRVGDSIGFDAVQLARAFIDLTEANRERAGGHVTRDEELLRSVDERIARARRGNPSIIEQSDDARALVRILENALAELDGDAPGDALLVGPQAKWFRAPRGGWQDLSRRTPMRLILLHLTEHRRTQPGTGVDVESLQCAGWPSEKMTPDAGANRVYVTLNKLRKLGLDGVLVRNESGYLLDPAVHLERITTHWRALRESTVKPSQSKMR